MKTKEDVLAFIKNRDVSLVGSVDKDGFPNVKAMLSPRKAEGDCLWFSTNTSSMRVKQFGDNSKACVYFFKKSLFSYVGCMLVGDMEVLTDSEAKQSIWKKGDTMYYNGGVTDPDYCVLRFTAQKCRCYNNLRTYEIEW